MATEMTSGTRHFLPLGPTLCLRPLLQVPFLTQALPTAATMPMSREVNDTVESSSPKLTLPEPEPAVTIIILIIYRTLGGLLPARYQVDRRSLRYCVTLPGHALSTEKAASNWVLPVMQVWGAGLFRVPAWLI